ncbi:hypothetical protein LMG8520_1569 [Lactococcus lactis subsp. lactis]|uniref:Uncharacterized protein n=2 Tax=Lactococcus lactis TaxID=1358 RepID=A0A2A5SL13_LACLH|nr:hypothetical protein LMG8520_1569 [Lactococcus lactis subsp. lactis]PCS14209.1 hypothetical protein RU90_GL000041 [Lactococcus lactis subsp. hordniae]
MTFLITISWQFLKSAHRISVSKIKFLSSFLKNLGQKKFS